MNDKLTLNEDFDIEGADEATDVLGHDSDAEPTLEDQGWEYVASKDVYDEDGFRDVYSWYRKDGNNRFFFSSDVDYGDPEYFDWETEGEEAAQEWFDSYGEDEDELTFVDNREEVILNNGDEPGFDEYDKVDEAVEDNLTAKAEIGTPRGTFYAYKGTWKDFENEDDRDDWGFWFDHYTDDNKHYKIMHNHIDNSAIAVLKEGLNESKRGFVEKYRGYSIHDAGDRYVITNENGLNVGETRFGIPVCRGMIDDMIDGKEADKITEAKRTKFPRGFNLGSSNNQNVKVRNPYNYTIQELSINNKAKTFERGNFSMGRADIELKNRQEYEDIVDLLKDQGYTEVQSDYHSLRNKTRKGIREGRAVKEDKDTGFGDTTAGEYVNKNFSGSEEAKKNLIDFISSKSNGKMFSGLSVNDIVNKAKELGLSRIYQEEVDQIDKHGLDNLKFIGNAKVIDIRDLPRIGDSFNGGTVVSVNRKPNQEGYRIYEVGVAEDPDHEFITSDDFDDGVDGINTAHWTFAVKPSLKESYDYFETEDAIYSVVNGKHLKHLKEWDKVPSFKHHDVEISTSEYAKAYRLSNNDLDNFKAPIEEDWKGLTISYKGKDIPVRSDFWNDIMNSWLYTEIDKVKVNGRSYVICKERDVDGGNLFALERPGAVDESKNDYIRRYYVEFSDENDNNRTHWTTVTAGSEEEARKIVANHGYKATRVSEMDSNDNPIDESFNNSSSSYYLTTVGDMINGAVGNMDDEDIDKDLKFWRTVARTFNFVPSADNVAVLIADGEYDPEYYYPSWTNKPRAIAKKYPNAVFYDVPFFCVKEVKNGKMFLYFDSEESAKKYVDLIDSGIDFEDQSNFSDPELDESCKKSVKESFDDDYDDFELAGIYGGDMTYCPICGKRLEYTEDGDHFCPKCEKSAWELAQERRKLDKERKNESVEENPDDDIEGTEWYSTDIKEIPYGKNKKRIKNRKLVDIDKEPVRNPVNEDIEDSKENATIIKDALASGSLDRNAFIDYVLTNTPDEMLSGAVNFIGTSNFDTEDDLDFLGDGVDVTDSSADDLFVDEDTLEDGSVITLKDYSNGNATTSQNDSNNIITTVQNDSEPACDDCDDLPDGVDITLVDVDDDKPLEKEKPLQEMGPLAATLLTAVAPVVADKVMDKVLPEEKEEENKVDDEVHGNADDDDVDIKGI